MANRTLPRIKLVASAWYAFEGHGEPRKQRNQRLVAAINFCNVRNAKEKRHA